MCHEENVRGNIFKFIHTTLGTSNVYKKNCYTIYHAFCFITHMHEMFEYVLL